MLFGTAKYTYMQPLIPCVYKHIMLHNSTSRSSRSAKCGWLYMKPNVFQLWAEGRGTAAHEPWEVPWEPTGDRTYYLHEHIPLWTRDLFLQTDSSMIPLTWVVYVDTVGRYVFSKSAYLTLILATCDSGEKEGRIHVWWAGLQSDRKSNFLFLIRWNLK